MKWLINIAALFMAFYVANSQTCKKCLNENCYFVSEQMLSWMDAYNFCSRKSTTLARLATEEEYNSVISTIKERGEYGRYWMALNDLGQEGNFTYVGCGKPMEYRSDPIAINNWKRNEHCMEVRVWHNITYMNDDGCWKKHRFICEKTKCAKTRDE